MKRLLPVVPLLLLAALLLSPAAALAGARRGLSLWWEHVLPALLPSLLCIRMAQELGLLRIVRHPRGQIAAVIGFSLLSGAPNGAKLLHALVADGSLSSEAGQALLPYINSVSPVFLLSIIASELLKNKALFLPMAIAFYGCALCLAFPWLPQKNAIPGAPETRTVSFARALSTAIESSMLDMLRIAGCILFACTLLSLLQPIVPHKIAYAVLSGLLEASTGAAALSELTLPLRLKASLMVGGAAFGGLSLALQTVCCYPGLKLMPYLLRKLLLGALVGLACYLLFPLFPSVSEAFASRQAVLSRSMSLFALLLSSILSVAFIGVLSLMIRPGRMDPSRLSK